MNMAKSDVGCTIGMTVSLPRLDLEAAFCVLAASGFEAVEVFVGQLGPGIVDVALLPAHAAAAARAARDAGLLVSTLNCIDRPLDPFRDEQSLAVAATQVAGYLRLGAAMGAQRILIWDGELDAPDLLANAPENLAQCIQRAYETCGPGDPPEVAVELHPNTFAFRHGMHEETAERLRAVGAGVCLDFCHAAVAFGRDFLSRLGPGLLAAVTHVHYADGDCVSEQLHFPPGHGVLNLGEITGALAGTGLPVAWDLFGWPGPRAAMAEGMQSYRAAVRVVGHRPGGTDPT